MVYIQWNPSSYLIPWGNGGLTWYGTMWGLSVLLGFWLTLRLYKREGLPLGYPYKLTEYVFWSGLIGARLGDVFLYNFAHYWRYPSEILFIWHGGLSSHGGAVGILLGAWLFLRNYPHIAYLHLLDILSVGAPLVGGLIRIGNLFNSEIVGKSTNVPWAFVFVKRDDIPRHPSQLYEALLLFVVFILLNYLHKISYFKRGSGGLTATFFALVFGLRFVLEFWKENADFTQLLALPFVLLGLFLFWGNKGSFRK